MKNGITEFKKMYKVFLHDIKKRTRRFERWCVNKFAGLFVFNLVIVMLVLLKSAGYFHPFLPLTVNNIVLASLVSAILLLRLSSRVIFTISLTLLVFATFLLAVEVNVWAERTMIYVYQSLVLGVVLLFFEKSDRILK